MCRTQPDLIESRLRTEPHWQQWLEEFRSIRELVRSQNRSRLDAELPDDLVRLVLSELRLTYYLSDDGWLRRVGIAHGIRPYPRSVLLSCMAAQSLKTLENTVPYMLAEGGAARGWCCDAAIGGYRPSNSANKTGNVHMAPVSAMNVRSGEPKSGPTAAVLCAFSSSR